MAGGALWSQDMPTRRVWIPGAARPMLSAASGLSWAWTEASECQPALCQEGALRVTRDNLSELTPRGAGTREQSCTGPSLRRAGGSQPAGAQVLLPAAATSLP